MTESNINTGAMGSRPTPASGTVDNMTRQAAGAAENVRSKVDSARQPAADKLHSAADAIHDQADRLPGGDTVSGAVHSAADKLETSATYIESHDTRQMMDDALGLLRRYPVQALLMVGALGFLIARALRNND